MLDDADPLPVETEVVAGRALGCVREVYHEIGAGVLESSYQDALEIALIDADLPYVAQPPIHAKFRGRSIGRPYFPDLVVDDRVILELKAIDAIRPEHEAQLLTYLRHSGLSLGFVVNFHGVPLGIKRKIWRHSQE